MSWRAGTALFIILCGLVSHLASAHTVGERHTITRANGITGKPCGGRVAKLQLDEESAVCWQGEKSFINAAAHILNQYRRFVQGRRIRPSGEAPGIGLAGQLMIDRDVVHITCREGHKPDEANSGTSVDAFQRRSPAWLLHTRTPPDTTPYGEAGRRLHAAVAACAERTSNVSVCSYGLACSRNPDAFIVSGTSTSVFPARMACASVSPDTAGSRSHGVCSMISDALITVQLAGRVTSVPSMFRVMLTVRIMEEGLLRATVTERKLTLRSVKRMGTMQPPG
eukprot:6046801-Prymnesium_polylepis.1